MRYSKLPIVGSLAFMMAFASAVDALACDISGPSSAGANQSFDLCGPTGSGYRYEWYGPGVSPNTSDRCVRVPGRSRGTYEYVLVVSVNGQEVDRCRTVVNVGGATGGVESCSISGPTTINASGTAELCATGGTFHSFEWQGPHGFTATTPCVTISEEGTYILTTRNPITGSMRQCTHRVDLVGGGSSSSNCSISGPDVMASGESVRLCGPSRASMSYRWSGPGGFASASRCVTASRPGLYTLVMRDQSGYSESCSHSLSLDQGGPNDSNDADQLVSGNCPRSFSFWKRQGVTGSRSFSDAELRAVAQRVDQESQYFNWNDDLAGFFQALSPSGALTQRKRAAREYAALLANVVAGEYGATPEDGTQVGLDRDTEVDYRGSTTTIGDLITTVDRMFITGHGNFNRLYQTLHAINNGQGIGPICQ